MIEYLKGALFSMVNVNVYTYIIGTIESMCALITCVLRYIVKSVFCCFRYNNEHSEVPNNERQNKLVDEDASGQTPAYKSKGNGEANKSNRGN